MIRRADNVTEAKVVRCGIYCRVSTDERLGQEFNSLHAQREAGEAFVLSRKTDGWTCLPDDYSDPGFSGATLDRPALQRLLADVAAGRVDCIIVHRLDRLSRSLLGFARLVELLDEHGVSFVSVTQPINTSDSTGRLMLHILLSFAQFERELISARTADKMSASRRKGRWTGGHAPLGYRVHEAGGRLVVDPDEAVMLREIFDLYLSLRSLIAVAEELNRRAWTTKRSTTKTGSTWGGQPFTKTRVHQILTNATCTGRVEHRGQIYPGEHEAILDVATFDRVQEILAANRPHGGSRTKNKFGFLLRGLIRCTACDAAMSPSTTKKGGRAYRFYICGHAAKTGWRNCPHPSLPAAEIEAAVVERIKCVGRDPGLVAETLAQVRSIQKTRTPALTAERRRLDREASRLRDRGDAGDHLGKIEARLVEVAEELAVLQGASIDKRDLARALALFDEVWACLFPREQERIIALLIDRIDFDAGRETVAITFRPTGIRTLAEEIEQAAEVTA
jgi:site-specific DNA recombinase